ncbi:MAG: hypothetical protein ABW252_11125 [Polyangiales bacterium]
MCLLIAGCGADASSPADAAAGSFTPDAGGLDAGGLDAGALDAGACPVGQAHCGEACVDLKSSLAHCGACANACSSGEVCSSGACALTCSASLSLCSEGDGGAATCVDKAIDRSNCGACGASCAPGFICASGTCALSCAGSTVACDGVCIDPRRDSVHCGATAGCGFGGIGAAGSLCASGNLCGNGSCQVSCPGTQLNCGGACVDPATDIHYCGATGSCQGADDGTVCPEGNVCTNGVCALTCAGSQIKCGGRCIDPQSDRGYCGATGDCLGANDGNVCAAGNVCSAGLCTVSCPGAQINCGGTCVNPQTDRGFCGASADCQGSNDGNVCANGQVCSAGVCAVTCPGAQVDCNGTCVDPQTDRAYCGATGDCQGSNNGDACPAGQVCSSGSCAFSCPALQIECGGTCIDPATDRGFCGATGDCSLANNGNVCASGEVCSGGVCALSCAGNQIICGGACVNPLTDRGYCGATGDCLLSHIGSACADGEVCGAGVCAVSCPGTQIECGGRCVDPDTDRGYCGATGDCSVANNGDVCADGEVCSNGDCALSCASGLLQCGSTCVNPQTDRSFCGATGDCMGGNDGSMCASGEVCAAGICAVSCQMGLVNCGGSCISPASNPTYCGATLGCGVGGMGSAGTTCTSAQACVGGSCADLQTKTIFVTSGTWTAAGVAGLAGADAKCAAAATAGGRTGTFKAWLSDNSTSATSRLTHAAVPYVRVDGVVVADNWADLTDGSLDNAIDKNESGGAAPAGSVTCSFSGTANVWTGSYDSGSIFGVRTCTNWTSTAGAPLYGMAGSTAATDTNWGFACNAFCNGSGALYCLQQ